MGQGIVCWSDSKKAIAPCLSVSFGKSEYPRVVMCMVIQKIGPHTLGRIPMEGNSTCFSDAILFSLYIFLAPIFRCELGLFI